MARPEYWIYVNGSMKKAQMHKSTCGSCRFGRQMQGVRASEDDWWGGPFATRDEAWAHAQSEALKLGGNPTACPLCRP